MEIMGTVLPSWSGFHLGVGVYGGICTDVYYLGDWLSRGGRKSGSELRRGVESRQAVFSRSVVDVFCGVSHRCEFRSCWPSWLVALVFTASRLIGHRLGAGEGAAGDAVDQGRFAGDGRGPNIRGRRWCAKSG